MDIGRLGTVGAWTIGVVRALTGVAFLAAPGRAASSWVGDDGDRSRYFVRAVGGRDLAIGAGLLWALGRGGDPMPWLGASVLGDAADALSSPALDDEHRTTAAAIAGGFGALGLATAAALRRR